ncbi:hypothetical protein COLO4_14188 [Corchorus olitorius]|uniref:Helicase C-terminal domain-containing protein n=1 Tax=Corchorus olitorius TaxID=93759 RepID=A0A1R3JTB5_9ROSI|nr:hypothetical protein COLO4_14188 [Corchorus olitorius]
MNSRSSWYAEGATPPCLSISRGMVVCHFATFENTRIKCTHPFWKTGTGFGYHFGGWGKPPVDEKVMNNFNDADVKPKSNSAPSAMPILRDADSNSVAWPVELMGTAEQIAKAEQLIDDDLAETLNILGNIFFLKNYNLNFIITPTSCLKKERLFLEIRFRVFIRIFSFLVPIQTLDNQQLNQIDLPFIFILSGLVIDVINNSGFCLVHAIVGGTSVWEDEWIFTAGVHVVVDECSLGFKDQIYDIFQLLPGKIQRDELTLEGAKLSGLPTNCEAVITQFLPLMETWTKTQGMSSCQVSLVINYALPTQPENYLHHIGRSGRLGRKGAAINCVSRDDDRMLADIQRFYNVVIEELPANVGDKGLATENIRCDYTVYLFSLLIPLQHGLRNSDRFSMVHSLNVSPSQSLQLTDIYQGKEFEALVIIFVAGAKPSVDVVQGECEVRFKVSAPRNPIWSTAEYPYRHIPFGALIVAIIQEWIMDQWEKNYYISSIAGSTC